MFDDIFDDRALKAENDYNHKKANLSPILHLEDVLDGIHAFLNWYEDNCELVFKFNTIKSELEKNWKVPTEISTARYTAMILAVFNGNVNRISLGLEIPNFAQA